MIDAKRGPVNPRRCRKFPQGFDIIAELLEIPGKSGSGIMTGAMVDAARSGLFSLTERNFAARHFVARGGNVGSEQAKQRFDSRRDDVHVEFIQLRKDRIIAEENEQGLTLEVRAAGFPSLVHGGVSWLVARGFANMDVLRKSFP
jgi:hypothetical protein